MAMTQEIQERARALVEEANGLLKQKNDLQETIAGQKDGPTAEQKAQLRDYVDQAIAKKDAADELFRDVETERKAQDIMDWAKQSAGRLPGMGSSAPSGDGNAPTEVVFRNRRAEQKSYTPSGTKSFGTTDEVAYTNAFRKALANGVGSLSSNEAQLAEKKALSVGQDTAGGFLVASEVMMAELIEALEDQVWMRQEARVLPPLTMATSIAMPTASDLDDATWTSEVLTGSAETATPFGQRSLRPHPLAKRVKLSNTLRRLSGVDVEAWVRNELANRFSAAEESAFMTGSGAQQPEGLFTSTLSTTVTAGSATDISYTDLVNVEGALKSQYHPGAVWVMHRTILKELHLLVDGNDRPLLREMPGAGRTMQLFDWPIRLSEYAPSSSASGLNVLMLGNLRRSYWIVDSLSMQIQVLDQLYAETNEIGYIGRKETDGKVADGNGLIKLQMA